MELATLNFQLVTHSPVNHNMQLPTTCSSSIVKTFKKKTSNLSATFIIFTFSYEFVSWLVVIVLIIILFLLLLYLSSVSFSASLSLYYILASKTFIAFSYYSYFSTFLFGCLYSLFPKSLLCLLRANRKIFKKGLTQTSTFIFYAQNFNCHYYILLDNILKSDFSFLQV